MIPDLLNYFQDMHPSRRYPAGLEHCCCFTSHYEYSEAAVIEGSGGKNSKVIEANPNMKASLHFSDSEALITAQIPHSLSLGPHERRVLGNSYELGICSIHQHAHVFLYDVL